MRGGKSVPWMTEDGGYTEKHPMWKEAYRYEILRQAKLKEKDELGGYEGLGELIERYEKEEGSSKAEPLRDFANWNFTQVYNRNRILNTKQRLRKRLTDMKRERPAKYHNLVKKMIRDYARSIKGEEDNEDDREEEEEEEEEPARTYRVSYKQPQKCPRPSSNPTTGGKSPSKSPRQDHAEA